MRGPLRNQKFASFIYGIYGLYSGLVYFTPVFGGLLADRWLGQRRTVMLGALMLLALAIYVAGWRYLPPDRKRARLVR